MNNAAKTGNVSIRKRGKNVVKNTIHNHNYGRNTDSPPIQQAPTLADLAPLPQRLTLPPVSTFTNPISNNSYGPVHGVNPTLSGTGAVRHNPLVAQPMPHPSSATACSYPYAINPPQQPRIGGLVHGRDIFGETYELERLKTQLAAYKALVEQSKARAAAKKARKKAKRKAKKLKKKQEAETNNKTKKMRKKRRNK